MIITAEEFNFKLTSDAIFFTDNIRKGKPYIETKPRNHDSISFQVKGSSEIHINGKKIIVGQNEICYNARGNISEACAYNCDVSSYIAVDFNFDDVCKTPSLPLPEKFVPKNYNEYKKLFFELRKNFFAEKPGYQTVCNGILLQIIGKMFCECNTLIDDEAHYKRIKLGVEYINENYNNSEISVGTAARKCNLSETYFRKIFAEYFNLSPKEYIDDLRLCEAKRLLDFSTKSICEIAEKCGFSDAYAFSHFFKKNVGISPIKYKKS